jgi:flagellar FliL protein
VKSIIKYGVAVIVQAGLAWLLVAFIVGPLMRGEELPWQKKTADSGHGESHDSGHEVGPLVPLEEILVNVADTEGRRFLKASMTLETDSEELGHSIEHKMPVLRGRVIDLLSSKGMEELIHPSSRDTLRAEILDALNEEVSGGEFKNLYFTEFLVQ